MKSYIKNITITAVFALFVFLGTANNASAFGINIGFGSYNAYGFNNGFGGYNVPINCFNAGYPCNGYFGGNNFNMIPYNYGAYGYGFNNYYMSSPTYFNSGPYYDYYPTRTFGSYVNPNMYSTWYGY